MGTIRENRSRNAEMRLALAIRNFREVWHLVLSEAGVFVKLRIGAAMVLVTAASACISLGPIALKRMVDTLGGNADASRVSLGLLVVLYVGSRWLARTMGELRGFVYARAERRMSRTLAQKLFSHVLALPWRFHLERKTGAITQGLTNGLQGYQLVMHTAVFSVLPVFAELGTILIVLGHIGRPRFLLLFGAAFILYGAAFLFAARRTLRAARDASAAQVEANARMTDGLVNCEVIKYFAAEKAAEKNVSEFLISTEDQWVRFYRQSAVNGLIVATIYAGFLTAAALLAANDVHHDGMTIGTFVLINSYMLQLVQPVETMGFAIQSILQGIAYLENMLAVFRQRP